LSGNNQSNQKLAAMDERESIIQKVKDYKQLVDTVFPVMIDSCWLYGSYARGTQKKHSDIDVAFVVDHLDDNYDFFQTEPLLWKLTRQIDDRIEPVLVARDTDYAGFIDEIEQTGIEIA
jgi:predicted nucleotidyltransferase